MLLEAWKSSKTYLESMIFRQSFSPFNLSSICFINFLIFRDLIEKVGNTANISFVEAINSKLHGRKAKEYLAHFQGLDAGSLFLSPVFCDLTLFVGGTTAIGAALEQPEDDVHLHSYKVPEINPRACSNQLNFVFRSVQEF